MTTASRRIDAQRPEAATPWWRIGMVWLVLGGPATVVVAGVVTAVIAINGADPVLDTSRPGLSGPAAVAPTPTMPAMQARNHAATPAADE